MKAKFESNVATQTPKTWVKHEPRLPWEVRGEDLKKASFAGDTSELAAAEKAPFGTRPVFLITLLVFIFVVMLYMFLFITGDNKKAKAEIWKKGETQTLLQGNLTKTVSEKRALEEKAARLQNEVDNLNVQNKTFMTVIENLSRINGETAPDKKRARR
ncbi:MAG: hypothetical protein V3S04_00890 [Candidatus Omnitrophota bacterium]